MPGAPPSAGEVRSGGLRARDAGERLRARDAGESCKGLIECAATAAEACDDAIGAGGVVLMSPGTSPSAGTLSEVVAAAPMGLVE